jgi:pimeloyl-ACP methyl ester carboxylesterase
VPVTAAACAGIAASEFIRVVRGDRNSIALAVAGGRKLGVVIRNGHGPLVVFEGGLGFPLETWSWVMEELRDLVPDVAWLGYSRPGLGVSPLGRGRLSADSWTATVHQLVRQSGHPGPLVLVGHSVGGLLIRSFAHRHPDLVSGLVLVDATHPQQFARSRAQQLGMDTLRASLATARLRRSVGLPLPRHHGDLFLGLPAPAGERARASSRRWSGLTATIAELRQCRQEWLDDAGRLTSVDPHPVAVVTAGELAEQDPVHGQLQAELAGLSSIHRHDVVQGARHESLLLEREHARHVAEAIAWARERASAATAPAEDVVR